MNQPPNGYQHQHHYPPPQSQQYYQGPPQQPPPPKKSRVKLVLWSVLGVFLVGSCGLTMLAASTPEAKAKREAAAVEAAARASAEKAESEAAAAAQLAANQKIEDDWRKACKVKAGSAFTAATTDDIELACRSVVRDSLKVPGSDDWPGVKVELLTEGGCNRIWQSYVVAKNAFGVAVKTPFTCTYDPRTADVKLKM